MTNARTLGLAVALLLGATTLAGAQQQQTKAPTPLQTFERWATYTYNNAGAKVCYAATQPTDTLPKGVNRDPVFMFITNRPKEGVKHEISVITGYPYKEGSKTTVKIGDTTFSMYTKDQGAWVENAAEESRFINAMKAGADMVITGTSRRGTVTTDTYSLKGVSAALKRIDAECQ
ncbi:invasion associated locus B family protein [Pleomorphomonas sp. JP5]|uniref:invasion associated locus B family protein n=1 Tax=Pleomorphomonas sp. JP5 TaxID=2942998 RepID=UPI00204353B6|nr:invasion associated locus B family protein [Pleomorphomonas sp. JP5]MCM5556434.1 invasion associated locus B family protein [Pleomorphomonas sp. JP5]